MYSSQLSPRIGASQTGWITRFFISTLQSLLERNRLSFKNMNNKKILVEFIYNKIKVTIFTTNKRN